MLWNNFPGSGHMDGWGTGTGIVAVVLLGVLVASVVSLILTDVMTRRAGAGPSAGHEPDTRPDSEAKRILDRRFAAGEIDEEEYHRRAAALRGEQKEGLG
jgi:putative membrane protein